MHHVFCKIVKIIIIICNSCLILLEQRSRWFILMHFQLGMLPNGKPARGVLLSKTEDPSRGQPDAAGEPYEPGMKVAALSH